MKSVLAVFVFALTLGGCGPAAAPIFYRSSGGADHSSSAVRTHFGIVRVWNGEDVSYGFEMAFIPAADQTYGSLGSDGSFVQDSSGSPGSSNVNYLLLAPALLMQPSKNESDISNFDIVHGISMRDTDASALLAALTMAVHMPASDSAFFHYACQTMLDVAPTTMMVNQRGFTSVATGTVPIPTWFTTCELSFYHGSGVLTMADGSSWSESIPVDQSNLGTMISALKVAIADLDRQH